MTSKHGRVNTTFAQAFVLFMNDAKNHREGCSKRSGSSFITKVNGVIMMNVGNRVVVRFTPIEDGFKREFMFYNTTASKRIFALLDMLRMHPLGLWQKDTGVVYMTKANGTDVKINARLLEDYEDLYALYNSAD